MKRSVACMMLITLLLSSLLSSCSSQKKIEDLNKENKKLKEDVELHRQEAAKLRLDMRKLQEQHGRLGFLSDKLKGVKARVMTNYGDIELEFFPDKAPVHCFNFITRAESGFYNNTQFHRIIPGFMIQGGDPNSRDGDPTNNGQGGPIVNIPHEFNDTKHVPGILSMARISNPAAGAGSQFFIMHGDSPNLNGKYTAFGKVTKGMDVVNEIATVKTYGNQKPQLRDHPVKPVVIRRIEVFRYQ